MHPLFNLLWSAQLWNKILFWFERKTLKSSRKHPERHLKIQVFYIITKTLKRIAFSV